jgi:membrane protease YdiL (CAAX protease family)
MELTFAMQFMTANASVSASSRQAVLIAVAVSAGLAWSSLSGDLLRPLLRPSLPQAALAAFPYLYSALVSLLDIVVMLAVISLAAAHSPGKLLKDSGIAKSPRVALLWCLVWLAPAVLVCLMFGSVAERILAVDVIWLSLGSPLGEELLFRGLAVGALVRLCGWRWWAGCLWPALFFGITHAGQGSDPESVVGVVAITAAGGLLFGWLFVRWQFNLWPPVLLHVGLNALFLVFAWGDSALLGWFGSAVRLGVVLLAIVATLRMCPGSTLR